MWINIIYVFLVGKNTRVRKETIPCCGSDSRGCCGDIGPYFIDDNDGKTTNVNAQVYRENSIERFQGDMESFYWLVWLLIRRRKCITQVNGTYACCKKCFPIGWLTEVHILQGALTAHCVMHICGQYWKKAVSRCSSLSWRHSHDLHISCGQSD